MSFALGWMLLGIGFALGWVLRNHVTIERER